MNITKPQLDALEHFRNQALTHKDKSLSTLKHISTMSDISELEFKYAIENIKNKAQVALHFHPDRLDPNNETVTENLLKSGRYKSQFETFMSNGSVSAHPSGERDLWEQDLFGGSYSFEKCHASERPKYGALKIFNHADGPAPRFGSCYFLLKPEVTKRSTFTYMDSNSLPEAKGTLDEFDYILSELFTEIFLRDSALGEYEITPKKLVNWFNNDSYFNFTDPRGLIIAKNLNHYIEAQVHGDIILSENVEALAIDPCFKNTKTGNLLQKLSEENNFDLFYHPGSVLSINNVPTDFRGPGMPSLAKRISDHDYFTAYEIGKASESVKLTPQSWEDLGSQTEILQELKLLWHVLVKFGTPLGS